MFLSPDFYNTVQIEAYDLFNSNPTQYEKLAKESAERDAKNKIEDSIGSTEFNDDVQEDFKIAFNKEEKIQIYMGAKKLKEANMVLASSGIYYDRDELRRLVASSEKPVFVVTGKTLTEDQKI